jgi:hypothetical protein
MAAISFLRPNFGPAPEQPEEAAPAPVASSNPTLEGLAGYIKDSYRNAADNRRNLGVDDRMMSAMRALRGEYDSQTLSDIKSFGGSEVYARITASKVRGCAALLREVYTMVERPWALSPTPEPELNGPSLDEAVRAVLQTEAMELQAAGGQPTVDMLRERASVLRDELQQQRRKKSEEALRTRTTVIDDVLWEGGFYEALWAALGDIATFPFAVVKGPVVRMKNVLTWKNGKPASAPKPVPHWFRCSPFDVYFAPWSQSPQDGYIIHRERINRSTLQSMRTLPGYNTAVIDELLSDWRPSNCDWYDYNESERADLEQRESDASPMYSSDGNERPMAMLSFYGTVSAKMLREWAGDSVKLRLPTDDTRDLSVFAYLVGNKVIGVTLNPHPTGRLPFYADSFERVPGSCYGNAIPDLIDDVQSVGNARHGQQPRHRFRPHGLDQRGPAGQQRPPRHQAVAVEDVLLQRPDDLHGVVGEADGLLPAEQQRAGAVHRLPADAQHGRRAVDHPALHAGQRRRCGRCRPHGLGPVDADGGL